ncbi:MAG: hypothetical protein WKH68_08580 [Candidatus Limnocylindria bacterium]
MDRPPPPPEFWTRMVKLAIVAVVMVVFIVVAMIVVVLAFPRLLPVILVGLLGAAVLLYVYRDRFIHPN